MPFGQIVIGPGGSGKTSYVLALAKHLMETKRRNTVIVNLDPANELAIRFEDAAGAGATKALRPHVDIFELVRVQEAMEAYVLGPNGGLMYCMELLLANMDWLRERLSGLLALNDKTYFLFDFPGQIELYTSHDVIARVVGHLEAWNYRLTTVFMVDSTYLSDSGAFMSLVLAATAAMMTIPLPHVNVLSKIDKFPRYDSPFALDFYTDVLDLAYLLDHLPATPFFDKYKRLNAALADLLDRYNYVRFVPMTLKSEGTLVSVLKHADRANGFIL